MNSQRRSKLYEDALMEVVIIVAQNSNSRLFGRDLFLSNISADFCVSDWSDRTRRTFQVIWSGIQVIEL